MKPWHSGLPLYVLIVALVAGLYAAPDAELKWACLAGLALVWLATPARGRR